MARYAWGIPGERILEPGDQVFYIIPVVEAVPRGKGRGVTLQPVFEDGIPVAEDWMPGIVRIVDRGAGALFTVYDHVLKRDVAVPESYIEYVPPFDAQLGLDVLIVETDNASKEAPNHKRKFKL